MTVFTAVPSAFAVVAAVSTAVMAVHTVAGKNTDETAVVNTPATSIKFS